MRATIIVLALLLSAATSVFAADWTGKWEVHWQNGSAQMDLVQHGDVVTGEVPGYGYKVQAKDGRAPAQHGSDADTLKGEWTDGKNTDTFELTRLRSGDTFTGFMNQYQWVSGGLRNDLKTFREVETSTPRSTFFNFIKYGNAWASGEAGADGQGESLIFAPNQDQAAQMQQVLAFRRLFRLVSQTTFNVNDVPEQASGDTMTVTLVQAGTGEKLPLTFIRKDGNWLVQYPSEPELSAAEAALYKRSGGKPAPDDAFRQLRNPRDTMRAFLEAMDHWDQGGSEHVERMLDLSDVPESSRVEEASLVAQYIRRDLQKLGLVQLLAIPDDETSHDPFVYFRHPPGRSKLFQMRTSGEIRRPGSFLQPL